MKLESAKSRAFFTCDASHVVSISEGKTDRKYMFCLYTDFTTEFHEQFFGSEEIF